MNTEPQPPTGGTAPAERASGLSVAIVAVSAVQLLVLVLLLRGGCAPRYQTFATPPDAPKIAGRTEREWDELLVKRTAAGSDALDAQLGPHGADLEPVLPLLIKALEKPDPVPVRYEFETGLVDLDARRRQLASYRIPVLGVLERMGPKAKSAVPVLRQHLTHQDGPVRVAAVRALLAVEPDAPGLEDALLARLADEDPKGPKPLAAAVKSKGPGFVARAKGVLLARARFTPDGAALPPGLPGAAPPNPGGEPIHGDRVLTALEDLGLDPFAVLTEALNGPDAPDRRTAARGLERLLHLAQYRGQPDMDFPPFVEVFGPLLADPDVEVRRVAFAALRVVPDRFLPAGAFAKGIEDPEGSVRGIVLAEMLKRPALAKFETARLRGLVGCENRHEAVRAALILLRLPASESGLDPEAARDAVRASLGRTLPGIWDDLRDCVRLLKMDDATTVAALEKSLAGAEVRERRLACEALADIGPPARGSAPKITAALRASLNRGGEYPETEFRIAACRALAAVAPDAPDTVRVLIESLEDRQNMYGAAEALLTVGPSAVPALRKALADKDPNVSIGAERTLKYFGPQAAAAVPDLIDRLQTYADDETAQALAWIGKPAAEPLAHLLRHKNPNVRRAAAKALSLMGPEAGVVLSSLEREFRDADVRDLVQKAIRRASAGEGSFDNWEEIGRATYTQLHPFEVAQFRARAKRLLVELKDTDLVRVGSKRIDYWRWHHFNLGLPEFAKFYLDEYASGDGDLEIATFLYELVRLLRSDPNTDYHSTAWNLAYLYQAAERHRDAVAMFKEALPLIPKTYTQRETALAEYARSLLRVRAFADAEPVLRELLDIRDRTRPMTWCAFNARALLGTALLELDKAAEALPLLEAGYEGLKAREADIPREVRRERLEDALRALIRCVGRTTPDAVARWTAELPKLPPALAPPPRAAADRNSNPKR